MSCPAIVTSRPAATVRTERQDAPHGGVVQVDARTERPPEGAQASRLEKELGHRADDQADGQRVDVEDVRQQQDAGDDAGVVDRGRERRQCESVLRVQRAGEDAGEALKDHRDQRDAHQVGREGALLLTAEAAADQVDEWLRQQAQDDGQDRERQAGQAENRPQQTPELPLVADVLHEHRHERGRADAADQQVVQDGGQRPGQHEGVGGGGRAEGGGDDGVANQAEATAEYVAEADEGGGAQQTPRAAPRYPPRSGSMALLARFACGCTSRVEIPAPPEVACERHGAGARLISMPNGQVRYVALPLQASDDTPPVDVSTDFGPTGGILGIQKHNM